MHDCNSSTTFSLALVTGATSGIGAAFCRLLAQKKIPLIVHGRDSHKLTNLIKELSPFIPVSACIADLEEQAGRKKLVQIIQEQTPDLVVNNAGFGLYGKAMSYDVSEQLSIVHLNVNALLESTLEAAKALTKSNRKGVILNVSSAADRLIFPHFSVYAASKAFVTHFSQSLDEELRAQGVAILTACPGMVKTAFRERASKGKLKESQFSMTPSFAAQQLWQQIVKCQQVHVFDWKTRFGIFLSRCLPQKILIKILSKSVTPE